MTMARHDSRGADGAYAMLKNLAYTKSWANVNIALRTILPGHFPDADESLLLAYRAMDAGLSDDKPLAVILMHRRAQTPVCANPYVHKPARPASHSVAYRCVGLDEGIVQALNVLAIERNMPQQGFYDAIRRRPCMAIPKLAMLWDFIGQKEYGQNDELAKYVRNEIRTCAIPLCEHVREAWPEHDKFITTIRPELEAQISS